MLIKKPRIVVNRSLTGIFAQLVDIDGRTLVGEKFVFAKAKTTPVEQAFEFGQAFGKKALDKKVSTITYDRNGQLYHGQIKAFADGLRKSGLQF